MALKLGREKLQQVHVAPWKGDVHFCYLQDDLLQITIFALLPILRWLCGTAGCSDAGAMSRCSNTCRLPGDAWVTI